MENPRKLTPIGQNKLCDEVEGIITLNCWAHARRKFIDAQSFDNTKASEVLRQIQLLYAVEKYCVENKYAPDEIKNYRLQNAVPILKTLHGILQAQLTNSLPKKYEPQSLMTGAFAFYFKLFLIRGLSAILYDIMLALVPCLLLLY